MVITAAIFLLKLLPMFTIFSASFLPCSSVFIKAPLPILTSSTMLCAPAASFLLIMLEAISGMLSTVAVTSRRAYSFLSAGARFAVDPITATPVCLTCSKNSLGATDVLNPGMDSSLSTVPPVWPRPLPDIFAILQPRLAITGAITRLVLSPTPPVLCLSTVNSPNSERSIISPECIIASVSTAVSSSSIPEKYIAIKSAEI